MNHATLSDTSLHSSQTGRSGPAELRFLAELFLASLPDWFVNYLRQEKLPIHTLNCATGEGNAVLDHAFPENVVVGLDSNQGDLNTAAREHPDLRFDYFDYLAGTGLETNVLVCFNNQFQLNDPITILDVLSRTTSHCICLMLPLLEDEAGESPGGGIKWSEVPPRIGYAFRLIHALPRRVCDWPGPRWLGDQVCLIYARDVVLEKLIEANVADPDAAGFVDLYDENADKARVLSKLLELNELRGMEEHPFPQEEIRGERTFNGVAKPQDTFLTSMEHSARATFRRKNHQLELQLRKLRRAHDRLRGRYRDLKARTSANIIEDLRSQVAHLSDRQKEQARERGEQQSAIDHLRHLIRAKDYRILQLKSWLSLFVKHRLLGRLFRLRRLLAGPGYVGPEDIIDSSEDPDPEDLQRRSDDAARRNAAPAKGAKAYPNIIGRYDARSFAGKLADRLENAKGLFIHAPCIDWSVPLHQRPQHMASAMAEAGYVVIYLTTNFVEDDVHGFEEVKRNLFLSGDLSFVNEVKNAVIDVYSTSAFYTIEDLSRFRRNGNIIVYEYIDHIDAQISGASTDQLSRLFRAVNSNTVDIVVCASQALVDDIANQFPKSRIAYIPNGVDVAHYVDAKCNGKEVPASILGVADRQRPIVGYFGALAPWLWYSMINELASRRRDLEFVFVGPDYYGGAERIARLSNVHLTGAIPYQTLPCVASYFDAAIIPFAPGPIAQTTSPLKLYEYLALGKPVVVTADMRECAALERILTAGNAEQFSDRLDKALTLTHDDDYRRWALEMARQNSWPKRAESLSAFLDGYSSAGTGPAP